MLTRRALSHPFNQYMMHKSLFLILFLFAGLTTFGQSTSEEFNFGFEHTGAGKVLPDNWFVWGNNHAPHIDSNSPHSGEKALLFQPQENRIPTNASAMVHAIPAAYGGEWIELKAFLKFQDVKDGPVGLMIRIDGSGGVLISEDTRKKNIQGTADWQEYSLKVPYPKGAETIYIGALLSGSGQLWMDDFRLLIDGKDVRSLKKIPKIVYKAESDKEFDKGSKIEALEVSKENIADLALLGKVWGFLKYYHPAVAKGDFNWDYELFRIVPKVVQANTNQERDEVLVDWINSLGSLETRNKPEKIKEDALLIPDLSWITASDLSQELVNQLESVKSAKRNEEHYYVGLADRVRNPVFKNEQPYAAMTYPDAGFRLLSLYRYWNIIQYYFPYKHLIEEDWEDVMSEFIPKFIDASNETAYKLAVLELMGRVHDTHANILGREEALEAFWGANIAPYELTFVENKAVVTGMYATASTADSELQVGDIISRINNKAVEEIVKESLPYTPASNYSTQLRDIATKLLRTNDTILTLEYSRSGSLEQANLRTYSIGGLKIPNRFQRADTCFRLLTPEIGYLYLGSIKSEYLPKIFSEIKDTKGLVIDLRCYPSEFVVFSLGKYLMPESTNFVKFTNGNIVSPGLFTKTKTLGVGQMNKEYYKGKVVILLNELSQSRAEYTAMAFRVAPKATVIGSTTAGADGNISQFYLPGGINTVISGIGIYYPDGRETQRVGIIPDMEVKPSIEGIRSGKDELLDKAVEVINRE